MADIEAWRNNLFRVLEEARLLRQARRIELNSGEQVLAGRLDIEGHSVEIAINVDPLWYHRLPKFILRPLDTLGFIPHIDPEGIICFLEDEGIIFDWRRPLDVIRDCLLHVERTLREGITGANQYDFVNEFEVYWARLANPIFALSNLKLSDPDHVTEIFVASSPNAGRLRITHDLSLIRYIPNSSSDRGPWSTFRALYLPLEPGTLLPPPQAQKPFWGVEGVHRLLRYCSAENRALLEDLLQKRSYTHQYLIIQLPRPAGDVALFGVRFEELNERHPLISAGTAGAIRPIVISRRDRNYLVQRGGGHVELAEKRVLLIGCGAVGGHLALELSRSGVEHLHLVDPDLLTPENTHRHILGRRYWGKAKASALKHVLQSQLPFSKAEAFIGTIEHMLAAKAVNPAEYDLLISAIGNPTSELALNEQVRQEVDNPPIIFTWIDPYGIGGHAVLTGLQSSTGCFECLYTRTDDEDTLHNRASFAAPNQVFRRSIAGCHNLFTPYGSLDAAQTALLAARLALDVLMGYAQVNRVRSWKGNAAEFTAAGFTLSARYGLSLDKLEQLETCFAHPACPICLSMPGETRS